MDKNAIAISDLRLLANAEPFGFGPTAAVADCFPHVRPLFSDIGYVGKGHTLDLQRPLPYDRIHDLSGLSAEAEEAALEQIFAQYDVFLTALDFEMAEKARKAGLWVAIYDPLTWYWKVIPPAVKSCHLYLAQDFLGVRERIDGEPDKFGAVEVLPPIISDTAAWEGERSHVLLNLGGLNNPYWSAEDTLAYARLIVETVVATGAVQEPLVIAANTAVARALADYGVRNFSRHEMQEVLAKAKYAFMTPGLGNIYDAAHHQVPTVWLPPANDSQGQQLRLLIASGMADGWLDWPDFVPGPVAAGLDYCGEQSGILEAITSLVVGTASSIELQDSLRRSMIAQIDILRAPDHPGACTALTARFGSGGAARLAEELLARAEKEAVNARIRSVAAG